MKSSTKTFHRTYDARADIPTMKVLSEELRVNVAKFSVENLSNDIHLAINRILYELKTRK